MSEFLAEAQVLVRPDTTKFRAELETQLKAATKGVVVPIPVVATPVAGDTSRLTAAQAQASAESSKQAAAATLNQAKANQILGSQVEKTTVVQIRQDRVNRLLTQSQAQLAEAEALASLKTTELAANRARLAASSRSVATAERAVLAAIATGNEALVVTARNTLSLAQAQELQYRTAVQATIAADRLAVAEARQARSSALAVKGAGATALAMAGARGATLAASSSFLIGAAAAVFLAESIRQAIDAEETFRRTSILLGNELATQLSARSQIIGNQFGLDDDDVLKFQTRIAQILKVTGAADSKTVEFSENIVKLAADMAAFADVPVDQTLRALQGGLAGTTRGLKQYGILLSNAEVQQVALTQSGKDSTDELTRQELVFARYTLILRDAAFQQGAFAAQSQSLTGQAKILRVNFENLQETIGRGLVPVVTGLVKGLNDTFDSFNRAGKAAKEFGSSLPIIGDEIAGIKVGGLVEDVIRLNTKVILLGPTFTAASFAIDRFTDSEKEAVEQTTIFDSVVGTVARTLGGLSAALDKARAGLPSAADTLNLNLALAAAGGDPGQELALLRQREARQDAFLQRILDQPRSGKTTELATKAANNLNQTRDEIQGILDQQAAEAKTSANKIIAARNEADQAFIRMLDAAVRPTASLLDRAGGTEPLKDDIKFTTQLINIYRSQIEQARKRLKDAVTRNQVLADLSEKLAKALEDRKRLQQEERQRIRDALIERQQNLIAGLQLNIQFFQITGRVEAEIQARRKLIAALKKAQDLTKDGSNAWRELRNQIAEENAAIKELQGEAKKRDNSAQEFFFSQLQAQQGFAANLMGNLITGPTAGLVGVPAPPSQGVRQAAAVQEGKAQTFPTSGQANTEISVLEKILMQLRILNGSYDAPEAITQKKSGLAIMDGIGGV